MSDQVALLNLYAALASPLQSGLMPASDAARLASSPGGLIGGVYVTPTVNFMVAGPTDFVMPLVAGKRFVVVAGRLFAEHRDAPLTTQLALQFTQAGVPLNAVQSTALNQQDAPASASLSTSILRAPDMSSAPIQLCVTTPAAGAGLTVCDGFGVLLGYYL